MSFSQKVTQLLKENGMTKAALAKEAGIPYTTLDSMLKRETDTARLATVFRMAKALGVSVEELVLDEESGKSKLSREEERILELYSILDSRGRDTVLSVLKTEADNSRSKSAEEKLSFPVYTLPAAAGLGSPLFSEDRELVFYEKGEIPEDVDFGIRISGDSMEPLISDGDIAYVKKCKTLENGEIGIFIRNGESLCKRYEQKGSEGYLVSLNPKYSPIRLLDSDDLKIVGKVIFL